MSQRQLKDDHFCFACGALNPDGLRLKITYPERGRCRIEFVPERKHQGWAGVLHGGLIATILDEAFAHALGGADRGAGEPAVTAKMTVRFKKPAKIGARILAEGWVVSSKGRVVECESLMRDEFGEELASASGKLIRLKPAAER
jgi:uncharacterized protein (TIGR00369 family)